MKRFSLLTLPQIYMYIYILKNLLPTADKKNGHLLHGYITIMSEFIDVVTSLRTPETREF